MPLKILLKTLLQHPNAPLNVSGEFNIDGSVTVNWGTVPEARSSVIHYGGANESDPHNATFMGYSESNSWTLSTEDVPDLQPDDKLYLYVQSFNEIGLGANDIEKAQYLNTKALGSPWSEAVILTAE